MIKNEVAEIAQSTNKARVVKRHMTDGEDSVTCHMARVERGTWCTKKFK